MLNIFVVAVLFLGNLHCTTSSERHDPVTAANKPFCTTISPFNKQNTLHRSSSSSSSSPCTFTMCDDPSMVLKYEAALASHQLPPVSLSYTAYVLAKDDFSEALVWSDAVLSQAALINAAISPFNMKILPTMVLFNSSFLFYRKILPFCDPSVIGDGTCHPLCNNSITAFDGGDCVNVAAFGCNASQIGNGVCEENCNFATYQWDGGDCCLNESIAIEHCKEPTNPLRAWLLDTTIKSFIGVTGEHSLNVFIARYAECDWCGAISTMPWTFNQSDIFMQGSVFNFETVGEKGDFHGVVPIHELGHTFGLLHTFRGDPIEGGLGCADPCFEGAQYPVNQNGSMTVGDLCSDTRPTAANFQCADPQERDCAGQPWYDTPIHNYMGFTYVGDPSCTNEFTMQQGARMRCYLDLTYQSWEI